MGLTGAGAIWDKTCWLQYRTARNCTECRSHYNSIYVYWLYYYHVIIIILPVSSLSFLHIPESKSRHYFQRVGLARDLQCHSIVYAPHFFTHWCRIKDIVHSILDYHLWTRSNDIIAVASISNVEACEMLSSSWCHGQLNFVTKKGWETSVVKNRMWAFTLITRF